MDRYIGGLDIARWFSTKISRQINLSKPQKEGDIQRIRLVDNEARVHGVECGICLDGDRQGVVGSDDFCGYIRIVKEITKALALHREGAAQGGQVGKLVASDHRPTATVIMSRSSSRVGKPSIASPSNVLWLALLKGDRHPSYRVTHGHDRDEGLRPQMGQQLAFAQGGQGLTDCRIRGLRHVSGQNAAFWFSMSAIADSERGERGGSRCDPLPPGAAPCCSNVVWYLQVEVGLGIRAPRHTDEDAGFVAQSGAVRCEHPPSDQSRGALRGDVEGYVDRPSFHAIPLASIQ
jgi:hypothetical protein